MEDLGNRRHYTRTPNYSAGTQPATGTRVRRLVALGRLLAVGLYAPSTLLTRELARDTGCKRLPLSGLAQLRVLSVLSGLELLVTSDALLLHFLQLGSLGLSGLLALQALLLALLMLGLHLDPVVVLDVGLFDVLGEFFALEQVFLEVIGI